MSCLQRTESFYPSLCKDNNKPKKGTLSTFFLQENLTETVFWLGNMSLGIYWVCECED